MGCTVGLTRMFHKIESVAFKDLTQFLIPSQMGVGQKGGVELVSRAVTAAFEENEGNCIATSDKKNAYLSVNRPFILGALKYWAPKLVLPFLRAYSQNPRMIYFLCPDGINAKGLSKVSYECFRVMFGVVMGDPLAPYFYAIAQHHMEYVAKGLWMDEEQFEKLAKPTEYTDEKDTFNPARYGEEELKEAKDTVGVIEEGEVVTASILDDTYMVATAKKLIQIQKIHEIIGHKAGFEEAREKTFILTNDSEVGPKDSVWANYEGQVIHTNHKDEERDKAKQGITIVGKPYGTPEYIKDSYEKLHAKHQAIATDLKKMENIQDAYLLTLGSLSKKAQFFFRISDAEDTKGLAEAHDKMILENLKEYMEIYTEENEEGHQEGLEDRMIQPFKQGGLGTVRMEHLKHVATLASWIDSARNTDIGEWFPTIAHLWETNLAGQLEELPRQLQ